MSLGEVYQQSDTVCQGVKDLVSVFSDFYGKLIQLKSEQTPKRDDRMSELNTG